jgi:hypothetical protein
MGGLVRPRQAHTPTCLETIESAHSLPRAHAGPFDSRLRLVPIAHWLHPGPPTLAPAFRSGGSAATHAEALRVRYAPTYAASGSKMVSPVPITGETGGGR